MSNTKLPELLRRVAHELRTYNPAADEYKGQHIHGVWAREIDAAIALHDADRERQAGEAVTVESIRAAGGIVHGDGNIFFTNIAQLRASLPAPQAVQAIKTPEAFQALAAALAADPGYAWSWHCAVWASAHDEGMETGAANRAAARFMHMAFAIDTSKNANFNAEHLSAAPSPDGKAEQAEAPSDVADEFAHSKYASTTARNIALLDDRILQAVRQPTASNAGERLTDEFIDDAANRHFGVSQAENFHRNDTNRRNFAREIERAALASKPPAGEQKPFAWATFDGEGSYDLRLFEDNEDYREQFIKRNGPQFTSWVLALYLRPQPEQVAQDREHAENYRLIRRGQHWSVVDGIGNTLRGEDLDNAVRAARARGEGKP